MKRGKFQESTPRRTTVDAMIVKAQDALQYTRQRRKRVGGQIYLVVNFFFLINLYFGLNF